MNEHRLNEWKSSDSPQVEAGFAVRAATLWRGTRGGRRFGGRVTRIGAVALVGVLLAGCFGMPRGRPRDVDIDDPIAEQPDIMDHKNYKFGREIPDWVFMEGFEIEQMRDYRDFYVFKFESPRAQSLQGAQMWARNFQAASELARTIRNRVEVKFAGSAAGDMDRVDEYMEEVVESLSTAEFTGYRPEADYWVQLRYYNADGDVSEEAYTYYVLYTIPRDALDQLVMRALEQADDEEVSAEERRVREEVKDAFADGL
jgi:hypothetical protein